MSDTHNSLWEELDAVTSQLNEQLGMFELDSVISFASSYRNIAKGTKALVLDRHGEYYALAVNGTYLEGVHYSFLGE